MKNIKLIQDAVDTWYIPLIFGLIFVFLGVYCTFFSEDTFLTLSKIIGYAVLVSSLIELYVILAHKKKKVTSQGSLMFAFIDLAIALILISRPQISFIVLSILIAMVVFVRSIYTIFRSFDLKAVGVNDWWLALLMGLIGIALSYILINNPKLAGKTVAFWIGIAFVATGVLSVFISFKLRKLRAVSDKIGSELRIKWDAINEEINEKLNN
ncbi:HdeD family acid-resistance protein [Winogradskyella sp. PG-2]|uniref:HdeD family acid-resistance protein n=1 Tax=Winogradskyella sp. PG-2 TaxID=754409 RepID=UPI0004588914|nr:DUF308 domain-containing protein [Winogradskyella sp. PG-2]BAO77584.1 hypothetical protein WPG_3354 [Winogradskyella sp. PG-2]